MTSSRGGTGLKVGKAITSNLVATLRNVNIVLVSVALFYTTLVTSITLTCISKFRGSRHEEFCSLVRWLVTHRTTLTESAVAPGGSSATHRAALLIRNPLLLQHQLWGFDGVNDATST